FRVLPARQDVVRTEASAIGEVDDDDPPQELLLLFAFKLIQSSGQEVQSPLKKLAFGVKYSKGQAAQGRQAPDDRLDGQKRESRLTRSHAASGQPTRLHQF